MAISYLPKTRKPFLSVAITVMVLLLIFISIVSLVAAIENNYSFPVVVSVALISPAIGLWRLKTIARYFMLFFLWLYFFGAITTPWNPMRFIDNNQDAFYNTKLYCFSMAAVTLLFIWSLVRYKSEFSSNYSSNHTIKADEKLGRMR